MQPVERLDAISTGTKASCTQSCLMLIFENRHDHWRAAF